MSHTSGSFSFGDCMLSRPKSFRKQCLPSSFRANGLFPLDDIVSDASEGCAAQAPLSLISGPDLHRYDAYEGHVLAQKEMKADDSSCTPRLGNPRVGFAEVPQDKLRSPHHVHQEMLTTTENYVDRLLHRFEAIVRHVDAAPTWLCKLDVEPAWLQLLSQAHVQMESKCKLPEIPAQTPVPPPDSLHAFPAPENHRHLQDGLQELMSVVQHTISESMERAIKPFFDEVVQHLTASKQQGYVACMHPNLFEDLPQHADFSRMPADASEVVLEAVDHGPGTPKQRADAHGDIAPLLRDKRRQPTNQQRHVEYALYEDDASEKVTTRVRLSSEDSSTQSARSHRPRTDTGFSTLPPQLRSATGLDSAFSEMSAVVNLPKKSFVVNFHRLITMLKAFSVIHEIINSTVLASFTLVRVGSITQLVISIVFMAYSMTIYTVHSIKADILEISDYRSMADLQWDDEDTCNGIAVDNPNRLIKALSYSRAGRRDACSHVTSGSTAILFVALWIVLAMDFNDSDKMGIQADDRELLLTLLLVGSVLLIFHLVYEWLFWRETQCCMPPSPDDPRLPWDPRKLGVPRSLCWFGLPSMWFSSREGYNQLCELYSRARGLNPGDTVFNLYPQELAIYALDQECSQSLTAALRHVKFYDAVRGEFLCYDDSGNCLPVAEGHEPEQLGMELVFFDCLQNVHDQVIAGEFLQPNEVYKSTQMRRAFSERTNKSSMPSVSASKKKTG